MIEEQLPIETKYKGYEIIFNLFSNTWKIKDAQHEISNISLRVIKDYIDKLEKKVFQRFSVYITKFNGFEEATVTSIDDEKRFWISSSVGKQLIKTVYIKNLENLNKLEAINKNRNKIEAMQKEINAIEATLEKVVI